MQTLVTGIYKSPIYKSSKAYQSKGFTLLEVMVVLFIIGITTSIAVVTMQRSEQDLLDEQARQLLEDFSYARDLALNRHRLVGWQVTQQGYRFVLPCTSQARRFAKRCYKIGKRIHSAASAVFSIFSCWRSDGFKFNPATRRS